MSNLIYLWKPLVEIVVLWFVIYQILLFFEGTRAVNVVRGIVVILAAFFLFQKSGFSVLEWLLDKFFGISIIALIIIFQPEIRQGLAKLGRRRLFAPLVKEEEFDSIVKQIIDACEHLNREKVGALIAIEKRDPLNSFAETGVYIDGNITSDLMQNIFTPKSLLHDGGLIIQHGRIAAAGCLFPLTEKDDISRIFGTRHRAALGLSETTDALIIVISEERQDISLFYQGRMYQNLSIMDLAGKIKDLYRER